MKRTYSCPQCRATLNPNVKVILLATNRGRTGLVLLDPQPGNYEVLKAPELEFEEGDRVEFRCPVCRAALQSAASENLAELLFRDEEGNEGRVDFSRVYGEHATYLVTREEVLSFGEDASQYRGNFFGEAGFNS